MRTTLRACMVFCCLAFAALAFSTVGIAADAMSVAQSGDTAKPGETAQEPSSESSFSQCKPACKEPEVCCKLSGLEAACLPKDDCFAKKGQGIAPRLAASRTSQS